MSASAYSGQSASDAATLERAAERWVVRLRATDCSDAERKEFERWRAADPRHDRAHRAAQALWSGLAGLAEDPQMQAWRRQAQRASRDAAHARRRRGFLFAGAGALAAGVLAVALLPQWWPHMPAWPGSAPAERYVTARGEQRSIALADGSQLQLNTETALQVRMGRRTRELVLEQGEAVFQVAHDAKRPFRVQVGSAAVTALGTRFNIRVREGDEAAVTLLEGSVARESADPPQSRKLVPGQRLTMRGGSWRTEAADLETAASWTEGRLVFKSVPLAQVVAEVNRYGPGVLVLGAPELGQLNVSGVFRIGEPERMLRALEHAFPVRAEPRSGGQTVLLPVPRPVGPQ